MGPNGSGKSTLSRYCGYMLQTRAQSKLKEETFTSRNWNRFQSGSDWERKHQINREYFRFDSKSISDMEKE